jgi:GAF domain-containing protein
MHENKQAEYERLCDDLGSLLADERDAIANTANTAALLYGQLKSVNWVGFYFRRGDELVLGPFQGRPACVRIALGRGVCGTAAERCATVVVPDVHAFPGHIACDAASNAEIVVPIRDGDRLIGVLDVDSPVHGRFDEADAAGLERVVGVLLARTDFGTLT